MNRHSLTIKLIAIYLGISIAGTLLIGSAMKHAFKESFQDNIKLHLSQYIQYIHNDLGRPPELEKAKALANRLSVQIFYKGIHDEWSTEGSPFPSLKNFHFKRRSHFYDSSIKWGHRRGDDAVMIQAKEYKLLFIVPDNDDHWLPAIILPLIIIIAVFTLLYFLTRRLFSPLYSISHAVTAFGDGDLDQRITLNRKDELGDVAKSFNQMSDRIQKMLESKRQLLLAISHELRSPLTRAKVATAMLENDKQRDEIEVELSEIESLISELLETERLNTPHSALNKEMIDLSALIKDVVNFNKNQSQVDIPSHPVWIQADATRLRIVFKNLLENAHKYTPDNAPPPSIRLTDSKDALHITIQDHGSGIDSVHLPHICEPFYRVDPARQRATGGYGLGLYLCRVIIEAHDGNLKIFSDLGKGATVEISLPNVDQVE